MSLETITGNLRDAYKQVQPETMLHVDQLMKERRINRELRNVGFYTADGQLYFLAGEEKTPSLAMTRQPQNLVLRHIDDAFTQLVETANYHPDVTEAQQAIEAPDTVVIDLTKLRLEKHNDEYSALVISTTKYDKKLNAEERKLAERVYEQGDNFVANMRMLSDAGISETRVFMLNPKYVQKEAKDGAVGRASWLGCFIDDSSFNAVVRGVNDGRLRGVRRVVVPKGDTPEKSVVPSAPQEITAARCYEVLLANPQDSVGALDDKTAADLLKIVTSYLATK